MVWMVRPSAPYDAPPPAVAAYLAVHFCTLTAVLVARWFRRWLLSRRLGSAYEWRALATFETVYAHLITEGTASVIWGGRVLTYNE